MMSFCSAIIQASLMNIDQLPQLNAEKIFPGLIKLICI